MKDIPTGIFGKVFAFNNIYSNETEKIQIQEYEQ